MPFPWIFNAVSVGFKVMIVVVSFALLQILEKLMYNRMYKFFPDNNLIYSLQFGFRQKFSTVHILISITESIRKKLDEGNIGYGIFVDLQKAFGTVEHDIQNLVCVVLLMNGLNLISQIENNMSQSMFKILKILM